MAQIKIREMPPCERPREKLLGRGAAALTDPELLAILLRTGVPGANAVEVARQLLERYGSLSGLSRCTVKEIASIRGIGAAKAIQLVAAFGLGQRLASERLARQKLDSPELIHDLVAAETDPPQGIPPRHPPDTLLCFGWRRFLGSVNESIAHPRDVFRPAVISSAYAVIVVHNHPSGDPSQSIRSQPNEAFG
jgi:DNA repair protein RadC